MYISNQCSHYTYINKKVAINEEFVSSKIKELQPKWSDSNCRAKKIQIAVDKDCLVKINGEDEILIKAQYGLSIDYADVDISSIVSLTDDVSIYAIIGY